MCREARARQEFGGQACSCRGSARVKAVVRIGACRAVTALPAMVGSLLLLVVLAGGLGRWEALVLLGWLAAGAALFTASGERLAVRVGCGFRRPSAAQAVALAPLWAAALRQSGIAADGVDLYVKRARQPNAYAIGGRSVAVTTGIVEEYLARRLAADELVAALVHELAHRATRALLWVWLASPWRLAVRLLIGLGLAVSGRQPRALSAVVMSAGVIVAVVQAMQHRRWLVAGVLAGVAVLAVICPLVDAAVRRRSELAADRFAAEHGSAVPLTTALRTLDGGRSISCGWTRRIVAQHPALDRRIEALTALRYSPLVAVEVLCFPSCLPALSRGWAPSR